MWKEPTGTWCGGGIQIPNPVPGQYPRFDNDEWSSVDKNTLHADIAPLQLVAAGTYGTVPSSLGANNGGSYPTAVVSTSTGVKLTGGEGDASLSAASVYVTAPSRPWHYGGLYTETHNAVDAPCGMGLYAMSPSGYPVFVLARVLGGGWQLWKDNGSPGSAVKDGSVINIPDRPWVRVVVPAGAGAVTVEWQGSATGEPGSWSIITTKSFDAGGWSAVTAMPGATMTVHRWIAPNQGSDNTKTDVPITDGGTGASDKTTAFDNLAPGTTKGDLIVFNGTDNVRFGAGPDGTALVADSTAASGLKWRRDMPSLVARNWFGFRGSTGIGIPVTTVNASSVAANGPIDSFVAYTTTEGALGAYLSTAYDVVRGAYGPELWVRVTTPMVLSNVVIWIGFTSAVPSSSESGASNHAMIRYSSTSDGSHWKMSTRSAGTQVTTAHSASISLFTSYDLRLRLSGTTLYCSINGGTEESRTGAPSTSQDLGVFVGVYALVAQAPKTLWIARGQVEFGS